MMLRPENKKEVRKAKNRLTAKKSRDKKVAYVRQLEQALSASRQRVAELESELQVSRMNDIFSSFTSQTPANMGIYLDDEDLKQM